MVLPEVAAHPATRLCDRCTQAVAALAGQHEVPA
jgi:hypothetical protein